MDGTVFAKTIVTWSRKLKGKPVLEPRMIYRYGYINMLSYPIFIIPVLYDIMNNKLFSIYFII